jgi:hypothetical protein
MQNPNSLTDKEKAIISDGLSSFAPASVDISNQIIKDLEILSDLSRYLSMHYPDNKPSSKTKPKNRK